MCRVDSVKGACKLTTSLDFSSRQGAEFDAEMRLHFSGSLVRLMVEHLGQFERLEPQGHSVRDMAETDEAPGLAPELGGLQRQLLPSAFAHAAVAGNELAQQGQPRRDSVLCHGGGVSGRRIGDKDSPLRASFDVDIVVTGGWLLDQLERSRLRHQLLVDVSLEAVVSKDDVRFGEGFRKLFVADVTAADNLRIGNARQVLERGFERFDGDWRQ
jgi:hypothetical protein